MRIPALSRSLLTCLSLLAAVGLAACTPPAPAPARVAARDPTPVLDALRAPWPLPAGCLEYREPGGGSQELRVVHLGGRSTADLHLAVHRVLDATELAAHSIPPGQGHFGGDRFASILFGIAEQTLDHVLASGLHPDPEVARRLATLPDALEIGVPGVEVMSAPPRTPGQLVRTLVTKTGTITVVVVLRPEGFRGDPGGNMTAGDVVVIDVHVVARESGFASPG